MHGQALAPVPGAMTIYDGPQADQGGCPAARGDRGTHAHLWTLPDGTGLHAPYGQLVRDPDSGEVCCHLCGWWFRSLGAHVRRHGYTAAYYREAMGLCRTRPLTSLALSEAIAGRQAAAYRRHPEVRDMLARGRATGRSGPAASARNVVNRGPSAELLAVRRETQRRARRTRDRERDQVVEARLAALGFTDLDDYLRTAYAAGASLIDLRAAIGLGTHRLKEAMAAADVVVRRPGDTTPAGRRSRARTAEREAAARVGSDDITAWLVERYAAGWSLTELGKAVGHSAPWVRWRVMPG